MNKKGKANWTAIGVVSALVVIAVILVLGFTGHLGKAGSQSGLNTPNPSGNQGGTVSGCPNNPTYSGSAVDYFGTTVVGGTDEYIIGDNKPITSLTNVALSKGNVLQYWKSNSTYYCAPSDATALGCDPVNPQLACYLNATVTLSAYDVPGNSLLTAGGGATNITLGATDSKALNLHYKGTSKQAAMPFGGLMVVEVPTGVTSVDVSGAGIMSGVGNFHLTYSNTVAGNPYYVFNVPAGFDAEKVASDKTIQITMNTGSTNPAGLAYVKFIPANYYIVSSTGKFALDTEQYLNSDTTRTGIANAGLSYTFGVN